MKTLKVSPSDFAFLYEECKRCFWLKANYDMYPPSKPMANIFKKIDRLEKKAFEGKWLSDIHPDLPKGKIVATNINVRSKYIAYPELDYQQYIKGEIDSIIQMEDGSYQIIDFKTSDIDGYAKLYMRQLHAYAYALENPVMQNQKDFLPISGIGIVVFDPKIGFHFNESGNGELEGVFAWKPLPYVPDKFVGFLEKFATILSAKEEPEFTSTCPYCKRDQIMIDQTKKLYEPEEPKVVIEDTDEWIPAKSGKTITD